MFARAVRVIASTGIFFILKIRVLIGWRILLVRLTLDLQKKILTGFVFMFCFYYSVYLPKHLKEPYYFNFNRVRYPDVAILYRVSSSTIVFPHIVAKSFYPVLRSE